MLSEKLFQKWMSTRLVDISNRNWIIDTIYWLIDSSEREKEKIKKFLSKQINNPSDNIKEIAELFQDRYKNWDRRIVEIQNWVLENIEYKSDKQNYGAVEYWATVDETLKYREGDCDDINSLIYVIARLSGIPESVLYNVIGKVKGGGGHYWLVYYSVKKMKMYSIDSTFYPNKKRLHKRREFKTGGQYAEIDYVFNERFTFKSQ